MSETTLVSDSVVVGVRQRMVGPVSMPVVLVPKRREAAVARSPSAEEPAPA